MLEESMREAMRASIEIDRYLTASNDYSPERSLGVSEDEVVEITVDRQGKLVDCVISEDWYRTLDPAELETAINDALTQAQSYRMETAQATLEQEGFTPARVTDEDIELAIAESSRKARDDSSFYPPRNILEVAEDTLAHLDTLMADAPTKPPVVTAHVENFSGTAMHITINHDWAERRSGSIIARAIILSRDTEQDSDDTSNKLFAESLNFFTNWSK